MIRAQRCARRWMRLCAAILMVVGYVTPALHGAAFEKAGIAASTPEAVQAGVSILRQGGNAIDAAAAVAFALMVTDPGMCSLGGRSQALIRLADGQIVGLDGATTAPGTAEKPAGIGHGYKTAAVPGSPAALEQMVLRYGKLPLKAVMQPAIELARNGFVINEQYERYFRDRQKFLQMYPGSAKHFLKADGSIYKKGDTFRQPALAKALEVIAAEGSRAVYQGRIAEAILADMVQQGGLINKEDLARYKVLPGKIVEGSYRGYRVVSRGDQCDGASLIEMLQILDHFNLGSMRLDDPAYLHLIAQTIYLGNADEELADWKQVSRPLADRRVREIDLVQALPIPVRPAKPKNDKGETTHLSVVDESGNAVALTMSIGPIFGTKVANPEFGFFYAYSYAMNDDPVPFKRDKTSQSPTIVFDQGKPFLVIGSAGTNRIPGSIVEVIANVIDHHMPLERALAAPRVYLSEESLRLEAQGYPETTLRGLSELGYKLAPSQLLDGYFGKVHAVLIDRGTGKIHSGFDPRGYGAASGF